MVLGGFWMDIGQPRDYLKGTGLYLSHIRSLQGEATQPVNESEFVEADWAQGNVLKVGRVDKAMRMVACDGGGGRELQGGSERGAGKGREAGRGLRGGERDDSRGHRAGGVVRNCIVGWRNRVQEGAELDTVFSGEDVTFRKGVHLTEYTICPNKSVSESNPAVSNVILWRVCSHKQSTNN